MEIWRSRMLVEQLEGVQEELVEFRNEKAEIEEKLKVLGKRE